MPSYNFNSDGVLDTGAELVSATQSIESCLDELIQSVNRFLAANAGQSIDGYSDAQTAWNQGQQEMNQSLTLGTQRLNDIHDAYVRGDKQGAQGFGY